VGIRCRLREVVVGGHRRSREMVVGDGRWVGFC
jgi:hypothetical protein